MALLTGWIHAVLTALASGASQAYRTLSMLTALNGGVSDALRTVAPLPLFLPSGDTTVTVNDGSNAYTVPFALDDAAAYTLPDKIYICLFKPGTAVPTDPAEILAAAHAQAAVDLVPEILSAPVVVTVDTLPLFEGRVAKLEGVQFIPVISHPDAI